MREYASDWQDHLHSALNHSDKIDFVQFVKLSSDKQLTEWLMAME